MTWRGVTYHIIDRLLQDFYPKSDAVEPGTIESFRLVLPQHEMLARVTRLVEDSLEADSLFISETDSPMDPVSLYEPRETMDLKEYIAHIKGLIKIIGAAINEDMAKDKDRREKIWVGQDGTALNLEPFIDLDIIEGELVKKITDNVEHARERKERAAEIKHLGPNHPSRDANILPFQERKKGAQSDVTQMEPNREDPSHSPDGKFGPKR